MSKTRDTGFINNILKYDNDGNVSVVSGSTTLLFISSSGAIITTGIISGSNALSASYAVSASNALAAQTASYVLNAQSASYVLNAQSASYVLNAQSASYVLNAQTASFVANAQSASNAVAAQTASYANSLTVAGTLTAQTLVVQTITSSVSTITGSTQFGSTGSNTHVFTGSVTMNPNGLFVSSSGVVGIGTTNPTGKLGVNGSISLDGTASSTPSVGGVARLSNGYTYFVGNSTGNGTILGNGDGTATVQALATGGSTGYIIFETGAGSEKMRITSAGLVGIGTSSPSYVLDVSGSGIRLKNSGGSADFLLDRASTSAGSTFQYLTAGTLKWYTGLRGLANDNFYIFNNATSTNTLVIDSSTNDATLTTTNNQGGLTVTSAQDNTTIRVASTATNGQEWRIQSTGGTSGLGQGKLFFKVGTTETAFNIPLTLTTDNSTNGGRVGIGNTSPLGPLHIGGALASSGDAAAITLKQTGTNETTGIYLERSGERKGYAIYVGGSLDSLVFQRNNAGTKSDVMTLTRDGYVGVGNQNPSTKLNVNNTVAGALLPYINATSLSYNSEGISVAGSNTGNANIGNGLTLFNNVASVGAYSPVIAFSSMTPGGAYNATYAFITGIYQGAGGDTNWAKGDLMFGTGNSYGATERMRITAAGEFVIGKSGVDWTTPGIQTENNARNLGITHNGSENNLFLRKNDATGIVAQFWYNATSVGNISITTSATSFNNTSDYRLKEDLKEINGLQKVLAIKTYDFKWKISDERMDGVLAHELAEVLPYAVTGDKDAEDEKGNILPQGVDYSKIVPSLVKAIQEQQAQIDELKAIING